jgi:hypothetical protein
MKIKQLLTGAFLLGVILSANAQLVLNEQFNYGAVTDSLTNPVIGGSVWKRHSGTGTPIQYGTGSLDYLNYPGNLTGGSASITHGTGSREDANTALSTPISSGSVYISFLLNVTNSGGTTGDYAFHLNDSAGNGISTAFKSRIFFKDGGTPGTFKLGLSKSGAAAVAVFTASDYNTNQTYMVLLKYKFNPGTANDDSVFASIIDSGILMVEPASYDLTATDVSADLPKIKSVCLRQGSVGTGAATFDGIRVAFTWADLISVTPTIPLPVTGLTFANVTQTTAQLTWTKPAGYMDGSYSQVMFIKADTNIIEGSPDREPFSYSPYENINSGTPYQHDAMARCVYNGDNESATISGLTANTTYHALMYVVRNADSAYSSSVTTFTTTPTIIIPPPQPVLNAAAYGTTPTTTYFTWSVNHSSYVNDSLTTLIFLKPSSVFTLGTPTLGPSHYTADYNFTGSGTPYQNDLASKCIFKGDGDSMYITGLTPGILYEALILVVNDQDSVYSSAYYGGFTTPFPPYPFYNINQINSINPLTGAGDSITVRAKVRGVVYGFNQRAAGIQILIRDTTGGITLFHVSKNFGYTTVTEGDLIEATGTIATFRGLLELNIDTIIPISTGHALKTPSPVSILNEASENDLVKIDSVKFITIPGGGIWPSASTNIQATTNAGDTIVIRVLATSQLAGQPLPGTTLFSVAGIGSQFSTSSSSPYPFNGYQIFPRSGSDIMNIAPPPIDSLTAFDLITPANNDTIIADSSNLTDSLYIIWSPSMNSNGVDIPTYTFELDTVGGDFNDLLVEIPTDVFTVLPLTIDNIYSVMVINGVGPGQTFAGIWRVRAESNGLLRYSTSTYNIFLKNNIIPPPTGLNEQALADAIQLYPNPANDHITVSGLSQKDFVTITDISGRVVFTESAAKTTLDVSTSEIPSGMYFVKVQSGDAVAVKKLMIR